MSCETSKWLRAVLGGILMDYEEHSDNWVLKWPNACREGRKGNCLDAALLVIFEMSLLGDFCHPYPHLMYFEKPDGTGHGVPIFRAKGGDWFWVEVFENRGVHGPFKDLTAMVREMSKVYDYRNSNWYLMNGLTLRKMADASFDKLKEKMSLFVSGYPS
jgi:hypothetical protein